MALLRTIPGAGAATAAGAGDTSTGPLARGPPIAVRRAAGRGIVRSREHERAVLAQDALLELTQRVARLDGELLHERTPRVLECLQGVGLASATVEGEHELPAGALPEGLLAHKRLELGDHLGVAPEGELGFDQLLATAEAQLIQPRDARLGEGLVGEIGQRRAAPQTPGLRQHRGRPPGVAGGQGAARAVIEPLAAQGVDLVDAQLQHVAGRPGDEALARRGQLGAQP